MVTKFAGMPTLPEIERIAQTYGLPASVGATADMSTGVRMVYAGGDARYPIGTKTAACVSVVRFWEQAVADGSVDNEMLGEIEKAAALHDLTGYVRTNVLPKLKDDACAPTLDQRPDSDFALVVKTAADTKRVYPVFDATYVKASAEEFARNRARLPYALRKQAAAALLAKLDGVDVSDEVRATLERSAGRGVTTREKLAAAVRARSNMLLGMPAMQAEAKLLTKVAGLVDNSKVSRTGCEEITKLLCGIDEATQLHKKYASGLDLPEDTCHELTRADFDRELTTVFKLASGTAYNRDDAVRIGQALVGLMPDVKRDVCGIAGDVRAEKFANWAAAQTDRGVVLAIERVAVTLGVKPSPYSGLL